MRGSSSDIAARGAREGGLLDEELYRLVGIAVRDVVQISGSREGEAPLSRYPGVPKVRPLLSRYPGVVKTKHRAK